MTINELYQSLENGPLILDGATGSNLQKAGMPPGVCPELWILEHEEVLMDLQRRFIKAGTDILYAPTFSGNRIKLAEYGLEDRAGEINRRLASISLKAAREAAAAGKKVFVAGDLTMTGVPLEPVGPMKLDDLIEVYKEQAAYLLDAGVDLFVVETMMSLAETRAAVIAVKELCDLPVIASMTFQEDGRTLYGTDPATAVVVLQSLGAHVVGVNCSTGPEEMLHTLKIMKEYARVPLLVKPNAGLPVLMEGKTVYPMEAQEFASFGPRFVEAGAAFLGGCCGTTPEHIRLLARETKGMKVVKPYSRHIRVLASERRIQELDPDGPFLVIGERINPTGKKKLQAQLRAGKLDLVEEMALSQEEMGAHILDINMGTSGIDEKEMMLNAIQRITMVTDLPLCIDTSYVEVMEAALRAYPGRALINSVSMEKEKVKGLLPLVKKYGAMFILLPLSDEGLPGSPEEKLSHIHGVLKKAGELGIEKDSIIVDGLVTTVGANRKAALETLDTIRYCREELSLCTAIGLSNISFGLPERSYVNAAFAAMAVKSGLTMAIANPSDRLLMAMLYASDMLMDKEGADVTYIDNIRKTGPVSISGRDRSDKKGPEISSPDPAEASGWSARKEALYEAVLKGNRRVVIDRVKDTLKEGFQPGELLDHVLIPAINEVGRLFDDQIYFLPQLISSANAMKEAIDYLEPMLKEEGGQEDLPVIVIATVEGDIHDIGKNLVALMLKNYGYQVYDLGKNVPAEEIIHASLQHNAAVIVLSALMTTTMMKMKETITLRNEQNVAAKVIIGGAVTTPDFADEIGADGWSKDAADAVRLVQNLLDQDT